MSVRGDPEKPTTRLYVSESLAAGGVVGLGPEQAHYLRSVLRLGAGALVALFNGRDGEWLGRIDGIGRGWASLNLERQSRVQENEPSLILAFAPLKRARIDFLAQKATELGVTRLVPVMTRHTAVERVKVDRLLANAIEAAEQSERLCVPTVDNAQPLDTFVADCARQSPPPRLYVAVERRDSTPVSGALRPVGADEGPPVFLIGPEGGFAASELDLLAENPFVTMVSLGARILRADTAALAVLACWQSLAGTWR